MAHEMKLVGMMGGQEVRLCDGPDAHWPNDPLGTGKHPGYWVGDGGNADAAWVSDQRDKVPAGAVRCNLIDTLTPVTWID